MCTSSTPLLCPPSSLQGCRRCVFRSLSGTAGCGSPKIVKNITDLLYRFSYNLCVLHIFKVILSSFSIVQIKKGKKGRKERNEKIKKKRNRVLNSLISKTKPWFIYSRKLYLICSPDITCFPTAI